MVQEPDPALLPVELRRSVLRMLFAYLILLIEFVVVTGYFCCFGSWRPVVCDSGQLR